MFELDPLWYKGSGWTPEVAAAPADWFAVEHQLLTGAINDCQQRGWLDLAWRLTVCLTVDAGNRGAVDQWCALAEAVLADLDKSGTDPAGAAFVALALGGHLRTRHTAPPICGLDTDISGVWIIAETCVGAGVWDGLVG